MNLGEVRAAFKTRSGRYDLVAADGSDNGADFYINAGQKLLDRLSDVRKGYAKHYDTIESGDWYLIFQHCRAVQTVFMSDDDARWELGKLDEEDIMVNYLTEKISELDTGAPDYFAPALLRESTDGADVVISKIGDTEYSEAGITHFEYNGIIWTPPSDGDYTVEVRGLFYSPELSADADESYWSVAEPMALLMAALQRLEVSYRNTEGANDWLNAIKLELDGISKDAVEEESALINQMEG